MSPEKDSLERILAELHQLAHRLVAIGRESAFEEIRKVVTGMDKTASKQAEAVASTGPRVRQYGYGLVKKTVRRVIAAHVDEGISREEIPMYALSEFNTELTSNAVANAIKVMAREGEIVSKNRRWFPGPKFAGEQPGVDAPGADLLHVTEGKYRQ